MFLFSSEDILVFSNSIEEQLYVTTLSYKKSRFNELSLNQDFYETVFMNKCI